MIECVARLLRFADELEEGEDPRASLVRYGVEAVLTLAGSIDRDASMAGHEGPSSADADELRHQGEKLIQFACALGFDPVEEAPDSEEQITTSATPGAPTRRRRKRESSRRAGKHRLSLGSEQSDQEEEDKEPSRKRGRADEDDESVGFHQGSQFAEVVEAEDLEDDEPLDWAPTASSTAPAGSTPSTSYVADLPRRPGHAAVRSASAQGKGDVVIAVQQAHYDEAVDLFGGRLHRDWPAATNGVESTPRMGVLPGQNGAPSFQHATREDAIRALLETGQPYGDDLHKFLALATLFRLETPRAQEKVDAAVPEAQHPEYARYFEDAQGNALPKVGIRVVSDSGEGANVDYGSGSLERDPLALFTFGGGTIGGAQNGARRTVLVGSEEDMRLDTPAVAATTITERTMAVRLYDVVVLAARSKPLYEIGPWLSDNEVGIAKVRRRGVSVVETKKGKGYGGTIWVYLNTLSDNFDLCWPGPGFVVIVTQQFCFSGYKNLKKYDKQGTKGMEVGRSGDFSTSSTKARTATVDGVKVTVPEDVWFGHEAPTPVQQAAMDQRSEDSARGGAATSGVDCNQVGAGKNSNNAARLRLDIPGATKARGLCLGLDAQGDGLAEKLATWIDTDTGAIREGAPLCGRPKFGKDGHLTRGKGEWKQDGKGYLVLGVHNGNGKPTNPWCGIGGTVPVVLVGGEWRVAKWALPFIKARKVIQRNTDNQRHGRVSKKAKT